MLLSWTAEFLTDRETMKENLPKCFKPDYEDVYLIIDCTEIFIEKSSQIIQQSCTWSEYKGHNTGKGLIALSPLLLPVFVSDIFPGSKSDEEIVKDSGILSLSQVGDRWLADKGFMVQHILDGYGVIVETQRKYRRKSNLLKSRTCTIERTLRLGYMWKELYEGSKYSGFLKKICQFDTYTRSQSCGKFAVG